jgi:hypothetical protein
MEMIKGFVKGKNRPDCSSNASGIIKICISGAYENLP